MLSLPKNCVIFTYPKMGKSGEFLPSDLKDMQGITGCTLQCKGYEELLEEIKKLGFSLMALSSQDANAAKEFKASLNLSFELISDEDFKYEKELDLKTFNTLDGKKFYHRQTLIFKDGKLIERFNFIPSPSQDAANTLKILRSLN